MKNIPDPFNGLDGDLLLFTMELRNDERTPANFRDSLRKCTEKVNTPNNLPQEPKTLSDTAIENTDGRDN